MSAIVETLLANITLQQRRNVFLTVEESINVEDIMQIQCMK